MFELSKLARTVDAVAVGPNNGLIALAKLTERYVGYPLRKEKHVRAGNWAADLNQTQMDCQFFISCISHQADKLMIDAANDVYASLLIYDKLMAMGKEREIEIVRRGMCSDHGNFKDFIPPLVSSNGQVVPHIAGRDGSKSPTAAQSRTIAMFIEGKNTNEIASEMGVKQATAQ
jgi:hypothetical protein